MLHSMHTTHHHTPLVPKEKLMRRLKIVEGQVRGLQDMLAKDTYCIDVITQTSAVKQALSNIEDALLEAHLGTCVVHQVQEGKSAQAIAEILKVYQLKRK
jgi:CsoR family transcriptional regulator, copper-sensing transcriptional repressor